MRIAVYYNLSSGGAKRSLYETIRRLSARHSFDVYTLSTADHEFADVRPFAQLYKVLPFTPGKLLKSPFGRFNQLIRFRDLARLRSLNQKIAKEILQGDYDLLYVQPCRYEIAPSLLRFADKVPTVYYCHEPPRTLYEKMPERPYDLPAAGRRKMLERLDPFPGIFYSSLKYHDFQNIQHTKIVLANSQFMQANIQKIYQRKIYTCYVGVDEMMFTPAPVGKDCYLLSVGSLTPLKGFDFLIQAVGLIPADRRPKLRIASNFQNPPEKAYLEEYAKTQKVDLELLGNVSDEQLINLYRKATLTVYAPIREPFGLVPLESMACATPVVAVREGGMQETILNDKTGYLVDRDPQQFADAIEVIYANPDKARELGQNGRQHVLEHWTWDRSADQLDRYFDLATQAN